MESKKVFEDLLSEGIIELEEEGELMQFTEDINLQIEAYRERIKQWDENQLNQKLENELSNNDQVSALLELNDNKVIAGFLTLSEETNKVDLNDLLRVILVLTAIQNNSPSDGAPKMFLPIPGDQLQTFLKLSELSIVYIWRHDCKPCDVMKTVFDEIFLDPPENMMLLAVYGPDWAELLSDEYSVPGGPATLFIKGGVVDSRLYGAHRKETIQKEIQIMSE